MKKWTTTKLIVAGGFGILNIIISLAGMGLNVATGVSAASGLINSLTGAFLIVFVIFLIQSFGAGTLNGLVYSIIALPLPLLLTPGFLPKIFLGIFSGFLADLTNLIFKKKPILSAFLIGGVAQMSIGVMMYIIGQFYHFPGLDFMANLLFSPLAIVYFILTGFAGILGYKTYKKLEHSSMVKRIQK